MVFNKTILKYVYFKKSTTCSRTKRTVGYYSTGHNAYITLNLFKNNYHNLFQLFHLRSYFKIKK